MDCDLFKKNISLYLDSDLPAEQADAFARHSGTCEDCGRELAAYKRILSTAADFEALPAPDHLWQRIEKELAAPVAPRPLFARFKERMREIQAKLADMHFGPKAVLAGGFALLVLGMLIGGHLMKPSQENSVAVVEEPAVPGSRLVEAKAERYLEKSKILFLGLINDEGAGYQEMNYKMEQQVARNLLAESAELKSMISETKDARLSRLIQELEMILWEIAVLEETQDSDHIELIRSGIERRGIMLKIYLNEMNKLNYR